MFKQAWRSYIASLHPRNVKKIKDGVSVFLWIYWLFINPIWTSHINGDGMEDVIHQVIQCITIFTPFILMW